MLLDNGLKEADAQFSAARPARPCTASPLEILEWVSLGAINYRGKVQTTGGLYVGLLQLSNMPGTVVEPIANTSEGKLLLDLESARIMGLPVHIVKDWEFGSFYGPSSVE